MSVCALIGWAEYQHYKHRDPAWVKLYRNLLSSEAWVCGTDDTRLVQVASLLLAARYNNAIPMRPTIWSKVASLDLTPDRIAVAVKYLEDCGFLQVIENDSENSNASAMLEQCYQDDMPEKSRGEERRAAASDWTDVDEEPFA